MCKLETVKDLFNLCNKGQVDIFGVKAEFILKKNPFDGAKDWVVINIAPLTPLHTPLVLGEKSIDYITSDEVKGLEQAIKNYKYKAIQFLSNSIREVHATIKDGKIKVLSIPESVEKDWDFLGDKKHKYINTFKKELHPLIFFDNFYFRALGDFTLVIDGHKYIPHYSYWLQSTYYIADDYIKNLKENNNL